MNPKSTDLVNIFGCFTSDGDCLFVGTAKNPVKRKTTLRCGRLRNWHFNVRVLHADIPRQQAEPMASQIAQEYRKKNQAVFNFVDYRGL